jgi:phospholipid/cholesterol/gamma-HCH transport system substrate-binding protein
MEYRARYVLIGAFSLLCLLAGFAFVYWIKNTGGLGARAIYDLRFETPVSGLNPGAGVLFNGVRVGAVTAIVLDPANPKRVTATISVDPATPIRADTAVGVSFQGLTGATAVSLTGGAPDAPRLEGKDGRPPLLVAGADVGRNLTESAQETLHRIDAILDHNAKPLSAAIAGIAELAGMLGQNSKRIENLLGGLENLTGTGTPKAGPAIYDLVAASDFAAAESPIKAQLVVPDPSAIILFDSQKMLVRAGDGTYSSVANAQWADNLPKLVQARIVQSFENAHQLDKVSRPLEQLNPEYRLELGIRSFYIEAAPSPKATVAITARLVDDKGAVSGARAFAAGVPAKSTDAADAAAALNRAFGEVAKEIVAWTVGQL